MDQQTLNVYTQDAAALCATYRNIIPADLYRFIQQHFHQGQATADMGCGSGRDVAWLEAHGYPTTGYDASGAMLTEGRRAYPGIDVREAALPGLSTIPDQACTNVLCCATLMHLPHNETAAAIGNLARIVRPGGRVVVSYLATAATKRRDDGRLFTALNRDALYALFERTGLAVLAIEMQADATRVGVQWLTLAGERRY